MYPEQKRLVQSFVALLVEKPSTSLACEQAPSEPARCEKNSASEERDSASEASGTRGSL